ncbi:hypothetical protein [Acetobacterium sp. KB-1]|jgi:hypothetical protein|uniref:hypothetical protein n=1 Tax=Acetobacterium sp. KB-1 TaxID=2184575 RepID=UPI00195504FC|nr:hypothetical protein [Acetobacterium sp. KB-1]
MESFKAIPHRQYSTMFHSAILGQLGLNDQFHHVIINQTFFLLVTENQALGTKLVD